MSNSLRTRSNVHVALAPADQQAKCPYESGSARRQATYLYMIAALATSVPVDGVLAQEREMFAVAAPSDDFVLKEMRPPTEPRDFSLKVPPVRTLETCWPADDCSTPDKPCYLELTQDDFQAELIGGDKAPLVAKAALRVRLCTSNDNALDNAVCEDTSPNQELDVTVFNLTADDFEDQVVVWQVLDTESDTVDTGPYTEVGLHNFFGVVCQAGDEPCRIAWQYCEVTPDDPNKTM